MIFSLGYVISESWFHLMEFVLSQIKYFLLTPIKFTHAYIFGSFYSVRFPFKLSSILSASHCSHSLALILSYFSYLDLSSHFILPWLSILFIFLRESICSLQPPTLYSTFLDLWIVACSSLALQLISIYKRISIFLKQHHQNRTILLWWSITTLILDPSSTHCKHTKDTKFVELPAIL